MAETIRVFVGCDGNGTDAESLAVFEYTLRKHASQPVDIVFMRLSRDPADFYYSDGANGWQTERWPTPFSAFRWSLPAYCDFAGKAVYADSDVWWQADIAELWNQEFQPGKIVMGKGGGSWRLCVSLWDCAAARDYMLPLEQLRSDPQAHAKMSSRVLSGGLIQSFEGDWNCLDGKGYADVSDPRVKALHYTQISSQPHLKHALPRLAAAGQAHWFDGQIVPHPRPDVQAKFDALLAEATEAGFTVDRYVPAQLFGDYRKQSLTHYKGAPQ